jgi:hypothetical protein
MQNAALLRLQGGGISEMGASSESRSGRTLWMMHVLNLHVLWL